MKYKTVVSKYHPVAKKMANEVESIVNQYAQKGWKLVSFSITPSCKAILVFEI